MGRYEGVSGWAAPFVDEETGEVLNEPKNVTPPLGVTWLAARQAECRARMVHHKRKAIGFAVRAAITFAATFFLPWFALSLIAWAATVVFGALALWNWELGHIAKRESNITLDD